MFEYDEERDHDAHKDAHKAKLTLTECIVALVVSYVLFSPRCAWLTFGKETMVPNICHTGSHWSLSLP